MSFELVDNFLQVAVLGAASIAALALAARHRDRRLIILAFAYACFAMGTLYYALCITITGGVPHVFYVSELSWIASWLFYLALQIARATQTRVRPSPVPALCAALVAAVAFLERMMGPSFLITGLFAAALASTTYLSVFRLREGQAKASRWVDAWLLACVALQLGVYASSDLVSGFARFNLYFAIDLALTGCFVGLLPLIVREVRAA